MSLFSRKGAPWVPSSLKTIRRMLRLAHVLPSETVYDLGSGDGRVLIIAAREFGAHAVGVEIDPLLFLWSQLLVTWSGVSDRVNVYRCSCFDIDLRHADVVVLYLLQQTNNRLMAKLAREIRPNARIVSYGFTFPGWKPVIQDELIRIYQVGSEN